MLKNIQLFQIVRGEPGPSRHGRRGLLTLRLLMAFPAFSRHRGCGRIGQTPYTSSTYQLVCGISKKALAMALTSGVFWGILQVFFPCPLKKCRCAANFNHISSMFILTFFLHGYTWVFLGYSPSILPQYSIHSTRCIYSKVVTVIRIHTKSIRHF